VSIQVSSSSRVGDNSYGCTCDARLSMLSVTRRAQSIVDVRQTLDPISTLLDDARAVAHTPDLPAAVAPRVVPGFCRMAIETACMETVRRRRLLRGESHDDVEALLGTNARAHPLMALVWFDDEKKTEEVLARLKRMGPWATSRSAFRLTRSP